MFTLTMDICIYISRRLSNMISSSPLTLSSFDVKLVMT
jgi:hypothetical protein